MKHIILCLLLATPVLGQVTAPSSVGLGELVVLSTDAAGSKQWEASDPEDLEFIGTAEGGIAFSSGCTPGTITIRCYVIDWEAKSFTVDRVKIKVEGDSPLPPDPPEPPRPGPTPPEPTPPPDPRPELEGIALIAHDAFASAPDNIKAKLEEVANNFEGISSRGAALGDWDASRVLREVHQANSKLFRDAGLFEKVDPIYRSMITFVVVDLDITDKAAVIEACQEIARGLRAVW